MTVAGFFCSAAALGMVLAISYPAAAFVGQIDTENRFPYVVTVLPQGALCTGVATYNGLIATAAHCVWDNGEINPDIKVRYEDAFGQTQVANVIKVFIPDDYPRLRARSIALGDPAEAFYAATMEDVGVPSRMIT